MRHALLLFLIAAALHTARADDLDIIVDSTITPEARGQAYARVALVDFPGIALKLARLRGVNVISVRRGPGSPFYTQPWLDTSLGEKDRIAYTLCLLWTERVKTVGPPQKLLLMLDLLEESTTQEVKWLPLLEISSVLHENHEKPDASMPPLAEVLQRIEKFAADPELSSHDRGMALRILFQHGDANQYLDLAIKYSSQGTNFRANDFDFREYTRCEYASIDQSRLSDANRRKFLRHGFALLGEVDDKKGGGFALATHLGTFLQIPPVQPGEPPFAPDKKSPRYQTPETGQVNYRQDTVINAWKWLLTHEGQY